MEKQKNLKKSKQEMFLVKQTSVDSNESVHKQGGIRMTKSTHKVHVVDGKKQKHNQSMLANKTRSPPLAIQGHVSNTVESNEDVKSGVDNQIQVEVSDTHSSGLNSLV